MHRIALYVFYEKNGEVRDYVTYCISGLKEVARDILVVVNGDISSAGLQKLKDLDVEVLQRENIGFDFAAYKAGIEHIGYDKLKNYDELILTNNSYYGPIYPFSEMFNEMAKRECDFWGINRHPSIHDRVRINHKCKVEITEHIQSYFLVFRQNLFISDSFILFWNTMPIFDSFNEAVAFGEVELTKYFEQLKFKSNVYMDFEKYRTLINDNPTILLSEQILKDRCPILKRKSFTDYKKAFYVNSLIPYSFDIMNVLRDLNQALYCCIWDDLLSLYSFEEIGELISLYDVIPDNIGAENVSFDNSALFVYICSNRIDLRCLNIINNVYSFMDVILITNNDWLQFDTSIFKDIIMFDAKKIYDKIMEYDNICFIHNMQLDICSSSAARNNFIDIAISSLLYNRYYIENIIFRFNSDVKLGMFIPFSVPFGNYNYLFSISKKHDFGESYFYIANNIFWIKSSSIGGFFDDFQLFLRLFRSKDISSGKILIELIRKNGFYFKHSLPMEMANGYLFKLFQDVKNYTYYFRYFSTLKYLLYTLCSIFISKFKMKKKFLKKIKIGLGFYKKKG